MPSAADRPDFAPPRDAGSLRAFGLALLVHALLIAALTWGVNWKRSDQSVSFEAELWSGLPQAAAPRLVQAPPPAPPPEPAPKAPDVKAAPPAPDVDIALEQEKRRKLVQQQKEREREIEAQKALDRQKAQVQAKKEKELKAQEDLAKRKAADEAKKAEARKEDARDLEKQKLADAAAKKRHDENIRRMMGQAGATGATGSTGTAQKAAGLSASYGAKVVARVLPNVVFTDDVAGNPKAEVEVRSAPDGTVLSRRLVKSSGNAAWDEAVLKAIDRTGAMPRDIDGRVPSPMTLDFQPRK